MNVSRQQLTFILETVMPLLSWTLHEYEVQQDGANSAADLTAIEHDIAKARSLVQWLEGSLYGDSNHD